MTPVDHGDPLDVPPGLYVLRPGTAERLRALPPFPATLLSDPDDELGRGLRFVDEDGDRRLYALASMALVWATVHADRVTALEALTGQAAARTWIEHGARLDPELRERVLTFVRPGAELGAALARALGPALSGLRRMEGAEAALAYAIHTSLPFRSAVLEVALADDGTVGAVTLLEGRAAWDRLMPRSR